MSINFGGINIGGTSDGGGGGGTPYVLPTASTDTLGGVKIDGTTIDIDENGVISATVDNALSSTSEYPVQNKVLYPSLSKFIPADTNITVELDGSGDFTTLADAFEYIKGKYSNGVVVIKLGDGTFVLDSQISITTNSFNFAQLQIVGNGAANTIIQGTSSNNLNFSREGTPVMITDVAFNITNGNKTTNANAIIVRIGTRLTVYKCNFTGGGIYAYRNATLQTEIVSFTNVNSPIRVQSGSIATNANTHTFNTVDWAFAVKQGGIIAMNNCSCSFTSTDWKFGLLDEVKTYNPTAGGVFYQGYDGIIMGKFTES